MSEDRHPGINMHKLPVGGGFVGILFALGSAVILSSASRLSGTSSRSAQGSESPLQRYLDSSSRAGQIVTGRSRSLL